MNTLRTLMAGILMLLALITVPVAALAAIDTTQPTTTATPTGTKGSDGWYTTAVTVTLTATDGAGGSGVAKTEYSLDNVTWQTYSAPFVLDKDGGQYIYFRSADLAGNIESPAKSQEIRLNKTGLVGWWKMDGDWKDASLMGNHGTAFNGVAFSTNSKIGTMAGSFDGVDDYVDVGHSTTIYENGPYTVESWIMFNGFPTVVAPVTLVQPYRFGMFYISNNKTLRAHFNRNNSIYYLDYNFSVSTDVWYHFAEVYDGTNVSIYVNGALKAKGPGNFYSSTSNESNNALIGRGWHSSDDNLKGTIDDVRFYNRALSASEIQDYYRTYVVKSPTVNPATSPTATPTITLSGTKESNTAIIVNGNILVPLDGTASWQAGYALSERTNSLTITALDSQNLSSLPVTLTVVLDTTTPQVTATTPTNNAILKTAPGVVTFSLADAISSLDFTATLNSAKVTNVKGFNIAGTWSTSESGTTGSVAFTPSAALSDGDYIATIKPTDTLGNSSSYTLAFTIDSTPPAAPTIDPASAPINITSKTITGSRRSDSASVAVGCAGAAIGPVSYPTATTWIAHVSGLKEGSNTITAYAVDTAGNQSAMATATITVDTTPPAFDATPAGGIYNSARIAALAASEPAIIYYTMDGSTPTASATMYSQPISIPASATLKYFARDLAGNDSEIQTETYVIDTAPPVLAISTLSDGAYTNNDTLNIAGAVTDNAAVKGVTVNDTAIQVNADGSFSHALLLKGGVNIITVAAADSAGNIAADTRTVTLDQTAPVLAVATPADNSKTGKMLLEVRGTVDETSVVMVKIKDIVQSAIMNGGAFTATITLVPGYNTIEITAADLAGNRSTLKRTVVFDDQVPSLAVTTPNQDIRTNKNSLTIKGTAHDTLTVVGVTISKESEVLTPPVIGGTFEDVVNFAEEKTYGIVVTATNEVGTVSSVQRNVIYDITPPVLGIDPVTSPTSRPSLSVTGTREAGTEVTVTCATATAGEVSYPTATTWLVEISGLREGLNAIIAASTDAAGNAATASTTVVLASRPPEITIKATPDIIWPPNHHMVPVTISGGVEANGSDIRSVSISVCDEYGKFEYKNLAFGSTVMLEAWRKGNDNDGRKYTITVVVTDKGGKTTTKTAAVTVQNSQKLTSSSGGGKDSSSAGTKGR